jgi:multiple sugar transport system permease protein
MKRIIRLAALFSLLGFMLFPIYWTAVTSFKENLAIYKIPPQWLPAEPTLANYAAVFGSRNFMTYYLNNFVVAFAATALSMVVSVMAGYSLSRFKTRFSEALTTGILSVQMFPVVGLLLSVYVFFRSAHLLNTRLGLVLVLATMSMPFCIWLIKGFFDDIPRSIEESAEIDGCSRLGILARIVVPLSKPGLLAIGLYTFMVAWDDFLFCLTLIISEKLRTLSVGISMRYLGDASFDWAQVTTVAVIGAVPMFFLFLFFNRYMIQGLTAGSVKG